MKNEDSAEKPPAANAPQGLPTTFSGRDPPCDVDQPDGPVERGSDPCGLLQAEAVFISIGTSFHCFLSL